MSAEVEGCKSGSLIALAGRDYSTFINWLRASLATILMVLLLIALFYHMALGLQVVIEDYIHSGWELAALVAMRLGCFALVVTGTAILRIASGGWRTTVQACSRKSWNSSCGMATDWLYRRRIDKTDMFWR